MLRTDLFSEIANRILCLEKGHPFRVGVRGITSSGKTTLANELAEELRKRKIEVIRTSISIDNFHNPKKIRYRQGKESPLGNYEDAHDYDSFKDKFLLPIGPGGNLHYQLKSFDLAADEYVFPDKKIANKDSIFIVDGTFLIKKDLYNLFDFRIFVETDFDIARKRGAKREQQTFGSYEKAEEMFLKRYHVASKLYLEQHLPQHKAHVIINNNVIDDPLIV